MQRQISTDWQSMTTDNPHPTLTLRKADRDLAVGVANVDATTVVDDTVEADDGKFWDEPETSYNAKYPHNHVYETEGGHLREYDDTVGAKRIHERHASGTGYEIGRRWHKGYESQERQLYHCNGR